MASAIKMLAQWLETEAQAKPDASRRRIGFGPKPPPTLFVALTADRVTAIVDLSYSVLSVDFATLLARTTTGMTERQKSRRSPRNSGTSTQRSIVQIPLLHQGSPPNRRDFLRRRIARHFRSCACQSSPHRRRRAGRNRRGNSAGTSRRSDGGPLKFGSVRFLIRTYLGPSRVYPFLQSLSHGYATATVAVASNQIPDASLSWSVI